MEGADGGCWVAADTAVVDWPGSFESGGGMFMGGCGRDSMYRQLHNTMAQIRAHQASEAGPVRSWLGAKPAQWEVGLTRSWYRTENFSSL